MAKNYLVSGPGNYDYYLLVQDKLYGQFSCDDTIYPIEHTPQMLEDMQDDALYWYIVGGCGVWYENKAEHDPRPYGIS
jgi:hypothetical protein